MTREGYDDIDLSVLAPPMQPNEALSSWLVRIADAHLITVPELEEILGAPVTGPDRGDLTLLPRIAAMTRVREEVLARAPLADLVAHPIPQHEHPFRGPCRAPSCWAVCEECLELDKDRGLPPYIRRAWTHPLATICPEHGGPLIYYSYSKIGIGGQITMYDLESVFELLRQIRIVLGDFDDHGMLVRAGVFLLEPSSGGPAQRDLIELRTAVSDLIDALATRMRPPRTEALISIFDDRFKGRVLRGVRYIPSGLWEELDADTRLICTRLALRILAEPVDPREDEKKFPTSDWPEAWYRHSRIKGWQSVFSHAIRDPLFLVATELPRAMVLELGERSRAWPADLRRRWTYAAAVGAFSGCVF